MFKFNPIKTKEVDDKLTKKPLTKKEGVYRIKKWANQLLPKHGCPDFFSMPLCSVDLRLVSLQAQSLTAQVQRYFSPLRKNVVGVGFSMSYSSEQSNACQPTSVDRRKIWATLHKRDQCDLVSLEYIGQQGKRGVTVLEMMPVMDLSNPATSGRLRRMSDIEYGRIDTQRYLPLLRREKSTGLQGADRILLAEGVTLADIQKVMAEKGYSYESYHAKRQEKKKNKRDNDYEDEDEAGDYLENEAIEVRSDQFDAGGNLENESIEVESDQVDVQFSENEENQEESNSLEADTRPKIDINKREGCDSDNPDINNLEIVVVRLVTEVAELKKNYTVIKEDNVRLKEDNVRLKEEIAHLKSELAKLEQKLSTGGSNRLVAMLDQALAPSANQNGKDVR